MSAAKHLDKIRRREYEAFTARCERAERQAALVQQHKEYRARVNAGVADVKVSGDETRS